MMECGFHSNKTPLSDSTMEPPSITCRTLTLPLPLRGILVRTGPIYIFAAIYNRDSINFVYCHMSTVFGGEKRSHPMAIQISSLVAAHNSLWVGTGGMVFSSLSHLMPPLSWPRRVAGRSSRLVYTTLFLSLC